MKVIISLFWEKLSSPLIIHNFPTYAIRLLFPPFAAELEISIFNAYDVNRVFGCPTKNKRSEGCSYKLSEIFKTDDTSWASSRPVFNVGDVHKTSACQNYNKKVDLSNELNTFAWVVYMHIKAYDRLF